MKEVVIVSTARTPIGKYGGALKSLKAVDLGGLAIKEALKRAKIRGIESDGMLLCAESGEKLTLLTVSEDIEEGSDIS